MSLLEVNPLIVMKNGRLRVLDAKVSFDGNALFRHPDLAELRDMTEEDDKEIEASKYDLAYVALDGNIGCMVNGAGLAMATMDIIKLYGAEPANFLDVGGGARKEKVTAAFKIITADPAVKGILVNIFGGIMRCDVIAEGVIAAVKEVGLKVPLVVRLEGTNVELGKKIINESGLERDLGRRPRRRGPEDRRGGEGLMMACASQDETCAREGRTQKIDERSFAVAHDRGDVERCAGARSAEVRRECSTGTLHEQRGLQAYPRPVAASDRHRLSATDRSSMGRRLHRSSPRSASSIGRRSLTAQSGACIACSSRRRALQAPA